jgi:hypothetical protein
MCRPYSSQKGTFSCTTFTYSLSLVRYESFELLAQAHASEPWVFKFALIAYGIVELMEKHDDKNRVNESC